MLHGGKVRDILHVLRNHDRERSTYISLSLIRIALGRQPREIQMEITTRETILASSTCKVFFTAGIHFAKTAPTRSLNDKAPSSITCT